MDVHEVDRVTHQVILFMVKIIVRNEEVNENVAHYCEIYLMLDANLCGVDSNLLRVVIVKD